MTRTKGLRWMTAMGAAAAVVAAMSPVGPAFAAKPAKATKPVTITFWSWVPGIGNAVNLFNKTHPGIHVVWDDVGAGPSEYTKLFTAISAHREPDVAQIEYEELPDFESTGALLNIAKYIPAGFSKNFLSWTWKEVTLGNAVYAVPQDTGPMVMFYRADIFKKYHLPVPTTWAQYAQEAATLHKDNPKIYITDFPPNDPTWLIGLTWQAGARWFQPVGNTWHVTINSPAADKVANYWQGLLNKGLLKTDLDFEPAWYRDLATGQVATWMAGAWGWAIVKDEAPSTAGDWRVTTMPQWTAGASQDGNWGGSTDAVFKTTKYPAQAAEFIKWLNTNPQSWKILITQGGLYPSYLPALKSPVLAQPVSFYGGENLAPVFEKAAKAVNVNFAWGPEMATLVTQASALEGQVVNHKLTVVEALAKLEAETLKYMKQQGFSATG